ncbi:hypothetical protein CTA1_9424 [Colletotrichum tanaceti]|uniref:Uncharacterized protein n=1 Tax=Colletotrichum tanaceti TaxID=1306861 RepID=A0A4U6XI63_9PEZI|nr:hypothetical protein CTA1_9424 [Colletotrichum tanaceti]
MCDDMKPTGGPELAKYLKTSSEAYNLILNSIDDDILLALSAHGLIQERGTPRHLFEAASSLFTRNPKLVARTITRLTEAKVSHFASMEVLLAYFYLGRICLEEDSTSQTISLLLLNVIEDPHPEVYRTHLSRHTLVWEDLVSDLRAVDRQEGWDSLVRLFGP